MRCPYCSFEQNDSAAFCEKCGANLKPAQQPLEQNPYQQQPQQPYGQQNPYQQQPQQPYQPYPPPYPPSAYDIGPAQKQAKSAMICGIIGLFCFGLIIGIIALVMGIQSRAKLVKANVQEGQGQALAGIILGIIGLVGWAVSLIWLPSILNGLFAVSLVF